MTLSQEQLWNDAVSFTREKSPGSFEQWFCGVQFEGLTEGVLCLRARDEFVREWVDRHFLPTLTDFLRAQTGFSIQVAWTVGGELSSPVATVRRQGVVAVAPQRSRVQRPSHPPPPPLQASEPRTQHRSPQRAFAHEGHRTRQPQHSEQLQSEDARVELHAAHAGSIHAERQPTLAPHVQNDAERFAHAEPALSSMPSTSSMPSRPSVGSAYGDQMMAPPRPPSFGADGAGRGTRAARPVAKPPEGLNPKYTFENFVIGPSNQLAYAAAMAAAGGSGPRHNPLFLCGGTGLGKTHLVHAVAHRFVAERPESRILYVSAEKFVNEFLQALQDQRMNDFRARYRERCDLLLVDDIQFFANKTQTQEEFFHAFNALHQADKQIIVTSDKYPQQLERMEERLVSRFSWGLVADIQGPELETRVAILRKKAQMEHIELSDEIVLYLAQSVRSNVRELEGTLIRLAAKSSLLQRTVDLDFVRAELLHASGPRASEQGVEDIQRIVCHHFKLRSADLLSKDRHKSIAFARHVAMYLCKQRLKCSFPELGRAFGNRDHTTVMSAVRKVSDLRTADPEVRAHLDALERKLGSLD